MVSHCTCDWLPLFGLFCFISMWQLLKLSAIIQVIPHCKTINEKSLSVIKQSASLELLKATLLIHDGILDFSLLGITKELEKFAIFFKPGSATVPNHCHKVTCSPSKMKFGENQYHVTILLNMSGLSLCRRTACQYIPGHILKPACCSGCSESQSSYSGKCVTMAESLKEHRQVTAYLKKFCFLCGCVLYSNRHTTGCSDCLTKRFKVQGTML